MDLNEMIEEVVPVSDENLEALVEETVDASGNLETGGFIDMTDNSIIGGEPEEENEVADEEEDEEVVVAPKLNFAARAESMGLTVLSGGTYQYSDQFSEIAYKNIKTLHGSGIVDDTELEHLAIYTKGVEEDSEWKFQNFVSDAYKFLGNATLINQIKESISAVGNATIDERSFMAPNNAEIRHEIVIRNANLIPSVGTIYPMMNITNTYNGTGASRIVFGMNIAEAGDIVSSFCTEKFGKIKQIHLAGASTELSAAFGEYVTIFGNSIGNLITENFTNQITEDDMLKVLDIIETKTGKKRRELISNQLIMDPVNEGGAPTPWSMTSWQLFLALTRFTSVETNLNAKRILENVAERVLVIPAQMIESLQVING